MKCDRCKTDVPDFMWIENDHPVLTDGPATITRIDNVESDTTTFRFEKVVKRQLCSDVFPRAPIHSAHQVDQYPLCMPPEYWERQPKPTTTHDDDKVTCEKCKRILAEMIKDIDEHTSRSVK